MPTPAARAALALALLLPAAVAAAPFSSTPAPVSPDGTRAVVDLPTAQHLRNTGGMGRGGPGTGAGLCVFTSIEDAARWQNVGGLAGLQRYMTTREGGGYPQKVDAVLKAFCASKNVPVPDYIQHTGGDDTFLDLAVKTGRGAAVTYDGRDDFYSGRIAHMVNLAHLDRETAAVIDNNRPGVWVWMSRADFLSRWRGNGGGWAVVLLAPPPPAYATPPAAGAEARGCGCGGAGPCGCGRDCDCPAPGGFEQCGPGGCRVSPTPPPAYPTYPIQGPTPAPEPEAARPDGWHRVDFADGSDGWKHYAGGRLTGMFDARGWHPADPRGGGWAAAGEPLPPGLPAPAEGQPGPGEGRTTAAVPTGVMSARIHESPRYSRSGDEITKAEAEKALTDDSDRWHLAAVGDPAFLTRVKGDVAALPAALRAKLHVQLYAAAAWQVGQLGLAPGVTLRAPAAGRVSADVGAVPAAGYTPAALADLFTLPLGPTPAPPKPKPDPAKPDGVAAPAGGVNAWLLAAGGVLLLILLTRRD